MPSSLIQAKEVTVCTQDIERTFVCQQLHLGLTCLKKQCLTLHRTHLPSLQVIRFPTKHHVFALPPRLFLSPTPTEAFLPNLILPLLLSPTPSYLFGRWRPRPFNAFTRIRIHHIENFPHVRDPTILVIPPRYIWHHEKEKEEKGFVERGGVMYDKR